MKKKLIEILETNSQDRLIHREGTKLEFKENFNFKSINFYSKTIAAFANNRGGIIIFGVTDSPRKAIGMKNNNFENTDPADITNFLNINFSPEIIWHMYSYNIEDKLFGIIHTIESHNKPIMSTNNTRNNVTEEGDIYYRYSGRSEKIKYTELNNIIKENRDKERKFWTSHIEKIATIGPENISLIDLKRGEITGDNNEKLVIDKDIIEKIKFIHEGHFVKKDGAPALRLIGNIEGVKTVSPDFDFEKDFYTTTEMGKELDLISPNGSPAYMSAVIKHYKIKENPEYYKSNRGQNLYSKKCMRYLKEQNIDLGMAKEFAKINRKVQC